MSKRKYSYIFSAVISSNISSQSPIGLCNPEVVGSSVHRRPSRWRQLDVKQRMTSIYHTHTHTHTHIHTQHTTHNTQHTHTHTHTHTYIYIYKRAHTHTHRKTYTYINMYTHSKTYKQRYAHTTHANVDVLLVKLTIHCGMNKYYFFLSAKMMPPLFSIRR